MGAAVQNRGGHGVLFRPYPPRGAGGGHRPAGGAAPHPGGLGRPGESRVYGLPHIDRGYQGLEGSLAALGGRIRRETRQEEAGC